MTRAENELKGYLSRYGYDKTPGLHIVAKRKERFNCYDDLMDAKISCGAWDKPVLMFRKKDCEWLAIMSLKDFVDLYRSWEQEETRGLPFSEE